MAVLAEPSSSTFQINERDLDVQACRGSGAGGQNRNKVSSAIQMTYRPTGLMVRCESERSQHQNRQTALKLLQARLQEQAVDASHRGVNDSRRMQVGSGMRGDKAFTVREQDGIVTCHATGKKMQLRRYLAGYIEELA